MTGTGTPPADSLRAFLSERDAPCPCCGYNLRALPGSRCPECNQELVLQVGLAEPRLAWFICGVIGIGASSGFCTILLGYALQQMVFSKRFGPGLHDLIPLALGAIIGAIEMLAWVRGRSALTRREPGHRWMWAAFVSAIAAVFPLWFFAVIH